MRDSLIFLPGLNRQYEFLTKNEPNVSGSILVIGSSSERIAINLSTKYKSKIELIVNDYESLMNSKLLLSQESMVNLRMMSYETTDFQNEQFNLIYAQASISLVERNKIIKELKRILSNQGILCIGEITALKKEYPQFVKDIFEASNLQPLYTNEVEKYYKERSFEIIHRSDFSNTLKDYYQLSAGQLKTAKENLNEQELKYYKKLINKISHESNSYLKLGGDKYIGFEVLIMQKVK